MIFVANKFAAIAVAVEIILLLYVKMVCLEFIAGISYADMAIGNVSLGDATYHTLILTSKMYVSCGIAEALNFVAQVLPLSIIGGMIILVEHGLLLTQSQCSLPCVYMRCVTAQKP